jgi:Sulfotransferase domain
MKNIFIISPRRSGTHLTIDLIVNNFNFEKLNDKEIFYDNLTNNNANSFIEKLSEKTKLVWSHYHDFNTFFSLKLKPKYIDKLKKLFHDSYIIYVYRDIRDTITSHYYRLLKNDESTFNEYWNYGKYDVYTDLVNNTNDDRKLDDILIENHKNWFSVYLAKELLGLDMEIISYEEIINDYHNSVKKIGKFLNKEINEIKDVRLKSLTDVKPDLNYSYNDFRKGGIGDWKDTFGLEWGAEIKEKYNNEVGVYVNKYIKDNDYLNNHDPVKQYFQKDSEDWEKLELEYDLELKKYENVFPDPFIEHGLTLDEFIENRYELCERKTDDVRYAHKVFFYKNLVLKFLYPCKADLDADTFNHITSAASKRNLLHIIKTYKLLSENKITPELYYADIYGKILFVVQERVPDKKILKDLVYLDKNWKWLVDSKIYPKILKKFFIAINNGIVMNDYIYHLSNNALINGEIVHLDLDGIFYFDSVDEMKKSDIYLKTLKLFKELDMLWIDKYGYSELEKYE